MLARRQYYNVVYGNCWLGKRIERKDTPRCVTAHTEAEHAAVVFLHGELKISFSRSEFLFGFCLTVEVAHIIISFHLKMVNTP